MARGYLQRHLFPYFSGFLPLNTAARRIEVDLKGEVALLFTPWWREGKALMSVLS